MRSNKRPLEVAGVDGCRAGWLIVRVEATERLRILDISVAPTFDDLVRATHRCAAVAVDIPIGLSDGPPRQADQEARRLLGWPRMASVFPAPIRPALEATTYEEACDVSFRACGKKMSRQAYYIMPKVREADRAMRPTLQKRVVEVHPEVTFWALNRQQPMAYSKKKARGKEERLRVISPVFQDNLASLLTPSGAARDDLYDACAVAWTASRLASRRAQHLPSSPPVDSQGLRMEIAY